MGDGIRAVDHGAAIRRLRGRLAKSGISSASLHCVSVHGADDMGHFYAVVSFHPDGRAACRKILGPAMAVRRPFGNHRSRGWRGAEPCCGLHPSRAVAFRRGNRLVCRRACHCSVFWTEPLPFGFNVSGVVLRSGRMARWLLGIPAKCFMKTTADVWPSLQIRKSREFR